MQEIRSTSNSRIKELIKLKKRPDATLLIEGMHLIAMAYERALVIELFTVSNLAFSAPTTKISVDVARKLSDKVTSDGHFALIKKPDLQLNFNKPLLYLDDISDPGNMGTLLRTALAFDFGGVISSSDSVSFYNDKVLAAAQGAHFLLPLKVAAPAYLGDLKKMGYQILVTDVTSGKTIDSVKEVQSVVVLGNEARGVSSKTRALASHFINIPIQNIESLNVAIAGALLMYELRK